MSGSIEVNLEAYAGPKRNLLTVIGLGAHALSQPGREFLVKIIEMGLYSAGERLITLYVGAQLMPCLRLPRVS